MRNPIEKLVLAAILITLILGVASVLTGCASRMPFDCSEGIDLRLKVCSAGYGQ